MTQEQKNIIKDRCERNVFSFDDLEVSKRDIISYVRELGFEYPFLPSNIDEGNIEWGDYKEIIRKGLQDNYNMARIVRELREYTGSNFAKRTLQYKLKESGVKGRDIRVEEWKYYLLMLKFKKSHGKKEMLKHFGLENITLDFSLYSISELAIAFDLKLDELYDKVKKLNSMMKYINSCKFTDYNTSLPYKDFDKFMRVVRGEDINSFSKYLNWRKYEKD